MPLVVIDAKEGKVHPGSRGRRGEREEEEEKNLYRSRELTGNEKERDYQVYHQTGSW